MKATQELMIQHEEAMTMINALLAGEMAGEVAREQMGVESQRIDVELFEQLKKALQLHARIEEKVFYPVLNKFSETKTLIEESYREHAQIDGLLRSISVGSLRWYDQLAELKRKVEHHAEEEERQIFPRAERLLGDQVLIELDRDIQALKAESLMGLSKRTAECWYLELTIAPICLPHTVKGRQSGRPFSLRQSSVRPTWRLPLPGQQVGVARLSQAD